MSIRPWIAALERRWYAEGPVWWLVPLAVIHAWVVWWRRFAYTRGWFKIIRVGAPVLVVGNITAGGSGKTPLTIALVQRLQARGRCVAVVSRGYGGQALSYPLRVTSDTSAADCGDEALLIARRTGAVVIVDPDRARAARAAIVEYGADFIVADDGLQHYALGRDAEIAVRDGERGYGNGWLLPAGPLREPLSRLRRVDLECVHARDADFWLEPGAARSLSNGSTRTLASFAGLRVHAVAGIGYPARFFAMLRRLDIQVVEHPMPDHHDYKASDLEFDDALPVLMTEKDGVKCIDIAGPDVWMVPVDTCLSRQAVERIDAALDRLCAEPAAAYVSTGS